jgi:tetratricopeptide (TPR) repeat protein
MTHDRAPGRASEPQLAELFRRYLYERTEAHAEGLGHADPGAEVTPFEAVPVQPTDPKTAWDDAVAAGRLLCPAAPKAWKAPADWPALVASREPAAAVAFGLGNYPQLVRDLHPLLALGDPTALRPRRSDRPAPPLDLGDWLHATKEPGQRLLAAGVLRLAGRFDEAAELLGSVTAPEWRAAAANESAALAWHRGDVEEAASLWAAQADAVPVLFNRGMAALFLGRTAEARPALARAVADLPESSAWHHLGQLYLALAAARG